MLNGSYSNKYTDLNGCTRGQYSFIITGTYIRLDVLCPMVIFIITVVQV